MMIPCPNRLIEYARLERATAPYFASNCGVRYSGVLACPIIFLSFPE
jgi:hypothetical protein